MDGKENVLAVSTNSPKSNKAPQPAAVTLQDIKKPVTCTLCNGLLASSLAMSCGHVFCGQCLFEYLNAKPQCPTCQVGMRAIPVRCLPLDGVVEAFEKFLPRKEAELFAAKREEGKTASNKLNKMFWWLQPQVPVAEAPRLNFQSSHSKGQQQTACSQSYAPMGPAGHVAPSEGPLLPTNPYLYALPPCVAAPMGHLGHFGLPQPQLASSYAHPYPVMDAQGPSLPVPSLPPQFQTQTALQQLQLQHMLQSMYLT